MNTVVDSKVEERHLQRHNLQLSQILSLMFQESSHHHRQILSFMLLFLMLLTQQDILVQDYLCTSKLTL